MATHTLHPKKRLQTIGYEIETLRHQRRITATLLGIRQTTSTAQTKQDWIALLENADFKESDMQHWHHDFETSDPDAHHRFLASLRIPKKEIEQIRIWSRTHVPLV